MADIHLPPQSLEAAALVLPSKIKAIFASGRPVIATTQPNTQLAQIVIDRGVIVQPANVNQFSKAILMLSEDTDLRTHLGHEARSYAIAHWDRHEVLTRVEEQFTQLIEGHEPAGCRNPASSDIPKS
jgi:colanic acid biosynthesis glycosyl transferase WcaI